MKQPSMVSEFGAKREAQGSIPGLTQVGVSKAATQLTKRRRAGMT